MSLKMESLMAEKNSACFKRDLYYNSSAVGPLRTSELPKSTLLVDYSGASESRVHCQMQHASGVSFLCIFNHICYLGHSSATGL